MPKIDNEFFELNFNIDARQKYFFNSITIENNDSFDQENFAYIKKILKLKGERYFKKLNKIIDEIDELALQKELLVTRH